MLFLTFFHSFRQKHEMGHVLGVGSAWDDMGLVGADFDGCPYLGANANREWQSISGCSGSVPIEADGGEGTACSHWDEDCLENEIMTGYLGDTDPIFSRITIATMEDIGYEVDYSQAETYTAANVNPLCLCGRRGLRGTEAALGVTEPHQLSRGGNSKGKLSKEGHAAAQAHGRRHLEKMHQIGRTISPSASDKVRYVGDQFVTVFYKEGDHIYGVHVSSGY
jgi:Leishmanolysin